MPRRSSLARLLRVVCLSQLALAIAWMAWRWPSEPVQAVAIAALILAIAPIALATEFITLAWVTRIDTAPQPSAGQLARAWVVETVHLFRTFYWRQPFRWRRMADHLDPACRGRIGVVLVHGFMCNRGFWNAWMEDLRERGHAYVAVNLEPVFGSLDDYARTIDEAVASVSRLTGRPPVLVSHSMGGLAARAWWRQRANDQRVAHLVTIGTPHGGTWLARLSRRTNGRQMRWRSPWLRQLSRDEALGPLPPTTCWYSSCDNVVFPASTATLPDADNRFVPGQPHVALAFHPQVRQGFLDLLERLASSAAGQGECVTGTVSENVYRPCSPSS
jgi:triacylglycerol esterase/lipase EstA (alpha/beta hydrolase family)